jgi:hypothetical protein
MGGQLNATFSYDIFSNTAGTQSYVLRARDNSTLLTFSHSATASVRFVHPMFYGFSLTNIDFYTAGAPALNLRSSQIGTFMNTNNRLSIPYLGTSQSILLSYVGAGYLYFLTPSTYPVLSKIKDPNGFIIHDSSLLSTSAFTYSAGIPPTGGNNLPSPPPTWRVYKTIGTCSYTGSGNFEFIF